MDDPDTVPRSGSGPKPSSGDKRARGRAGGRNAPIDMGMLPDLIGYNLRFAQVSVFQHFTAKLGSYGISAPQFGTLLLIDANPGVSSGFGQHRARHCEPRAQHRDPQRSTDTDFH